MPTLVAENGPLAGQRLDVEGELVIGRVDGDVVIEDVKLSRRHAIFRVVDGGLEVEDLGSTNGTFVEERRVDGPTRLDNGAHVKLGASLFIAEIAAAIGATEAQTIEPTSGATQIGAMPAERRARPAEALSPAETLPPPQPLPAPLGPPRPVAVGAFAPPTPRRGGLATRSWVPVALSYGSVLVVAVALVVYFAAR